jgi:hypothetical protein
VAGNVPEVSGADEMILTEPLRRLVDRLRSMPESRLARTDDRLGGESVADAAQRLAQWCALATAGVQGRRAAAPPTAPTVPRIGDLASGDQVAVVCGELLVALEGLDPASPVWLDRARTTAGDVAVELERHMGELRAVV